jgi:hypothetical protein
LSAHLLCPYARQAYEHPDHRTVNVRTLQHGPGTDRRVKQVMGIYCIPVTGLVNPVSCQDQNPAEIMHLRWQGIASQPIGAASRNAGRTR